MATLKHIASKNSDYTAIEAYLVYQHDAFTGKQLLDEQGKPKLRDSYLLDTLECGDFSFATACLLANRKYGKNTQHGDIKSHQYIISFDPRDAADNGLTMEKAQALGLKFCSENFPGHPAIVCTHPDGHNHSGNIHVHIVIGSIRTREVERKPFMQKPRDWLAADERKNPTRYHDSGMLFRLPNGLAVEPVLIRKKFLKWQDAHPEFPRIVFHGLRHSSATYQLMISGGDVKAVQGTTGHATADMLVNTYAHIQQSSRVELGKKFEEGFYAKSDTPSPQAVPAAGEPTISMTALLELLKNADPEIKAQLRLALLT